MTKELIVIEENKAHEVFTTTGIDTALATVRAKVAEFEPDLSTVTSRKEIASMAYKVSRSKTAIDDIGKAFAKNIKDGRKRWAVEMDKIRDEVRKPLDDWEVEDEKRVAVINERVETLRSFSKIHAATGEAFTADELRDRLLNLHAIIISKELFAEFNQVATESKEHCIVCLEHAITQRQKFEDDQAELQRLRDEEAVRLAAEKVEPVTEVVTVSIPDAATRAGVDGFYKLGNALSNAVAGEIDGGFMDEGMDDSKPDTYTGSPYDGTGLKPPAKTQSPVKTDLEHKRAVNQSILADVMQLTGLPEASAKLFVADLVMGKIEHVSVNY